ncbi:flagellar motor protein MotB [Paenibacillus turicensis]|uniref:flagellar motor protein MotB n=1 Tax=Paenibacillus turicensis TaxID=160487 RepID=UPI003D289E9E
MSKNKRHEEHEEHADESWLLPYSDLMTLLLAMFIVLYGMSNVNAQKFQQMSEAFNSVLSGGSGLLESNAMISNDKKSMGGATIIDEAAQAAKKKRAALQRQEEENLSALKEQLDEYIANNGLSNDLETKLNQSQLMITISDKALFASGDAELKPNARALAKSISKMLEKFPDYEILITGHTDNIPINTQKFRDNWDLSSARALNFTRVLLINPLLSPKLVTAIGSGEYRPIATNDTAAGRAQNRRVEVSIIRKYQDTTDTMSVNP